jgi:hypothetical protein
MNNQDRRPSPETWEKYLADLEKALVQLENNQSPQGVPPAPWAQEWAAKALYEMLLATPEIPARLRTLAFLLMRGYADHRRGNDSSVFYRHPSSNRPPRLLQDAAYVAHVLKAMDLLCPPHSPPDAARMIWKAGRWSGLIKTPQTILNWQKEVGAGRMSSDVMGIYRQQTLPDEAGTSREAQAAWLLATLGRRPPCVKGGS